MIIIRYAQIYIMKIILTDIHGIFPQNSIIPEMAHYEKTDIKGSLRV